MRINLKFGGMRMECLTLNVDRKLKFDVGRWTLGVGH
jgi:hypothetical protein